MTHAFGFGVRDHADQLFHQVGMGKYDDGAMSMFGDKRHRSSLGKTLVETDKKNAIARYFKLGEKTKKKALDFIGNFTREDTSVTWSKYMDFMAVHFAAEEVADSYYGAETGNEIFVVYPSEFIASQYFFAGDASGGEFDQYNDMWVWANEEKGLSLDSGVVFIPEDAAVDPRTGSKYKINESGDVEFNLQLINHVKEVIKSDTFLKNYKKYSKTIGDLSGAEKKRYFSEHTDDIKNTLGLDDELFEIVFDYRFLQDITAHEEDVMSQVDFDAVVDTRLLEKRVKFAKSKDTVTSKIFWEQYFAEHPKANHQKQSITKAKIQLLQ